MLRGRSRDTLTGITFKARWRWDKEQLDGKCLLLVVSTPPHRLLHGKSQPGFGEVDVDQKSRLIDPSVSGHQIVVRRSEGRRHRGFSKPSYAQ